MHSQINILFCDLKRQYISIKEHIDKTISKVLSSGWFVLGTEVESFEQIFAQYCNCSFGIGVGSGTEALYLSLLASDIKLGDEVITVANAGVPTVVAITLTGAVPVFVDINYKSYNIDSSKIEEKITDKTRAIIPVHLYGQCADMDPIIMIGKKYNLVVIEDACQSHGTLYKGKKAGSLGDMGCFSFYPTKNLGAYGDGGMIVTNNNELATRLKLLRNYGQTQRYYHEIKGINSRLDEIQAAILKIKLQYLDDWNKKRNKIAAIYNKQIINELIIKPEKMGYGSHIYHLYVIACRYRDKLQEYLKSNGIQTLIHYPIPVYLQRAYEDLRFNNFCQMTEEYSKMVLSIPLYPEMKEEEAYYICEVLNKFRV